MALVYEEYGCMLSCVRYRMRDGSDVFIFREFKYVLYLHLK